jgi:ferrochelatase
VDSVLLLGFGGPTRPEHVLPYLRVVTCGRGVPEERLEEVAHHYLEIGGSPYNARTEELRAALEAWLGRRGHPLPVYAGMRNWDPFLFDTVHRMNRDGRRHAAGVILSAHRSEASWERYRRDFHGARLANHGVAPGISYVGALYADPGFLEAAAQLLEGASGYRRGSWPSGVPVLFSAHSIPLRMPGRESYESDLRASCQGVARILELPDWELVYQSRSGDPRAPWLEPDVGEAIRRRAAAGAQQIVLQAIGFLSDHVEVLFDLDVEAQQLAEELGVCLRRAPCVNAHPEFVAAVGSAVLRLAEGAA